jgi:cyclic patellamide precursor peptide PatG
MEPGEHAATPPTNAAPCPTCGAGAEAGAPGTPETAVSPPSFILALGRVEPRFPSIGVEKELAQAVGRSDTTGQTDRRAFHSALSQRSNRYLARQLCWVLTIEGLETYVLVPRDPADLDLLLETIRPDPRSTDMDMIVGVRGPLAPPQMCNGLTVPVVVVDQIYSFDRDSLVGAIPRPEALSAEDFQPVAGELFDRILQLADNAGALDEHRALNYLAVRYPPIYAKAAESFGRSFSLAGVEVRLSRLSGTRKIMDVIFSYSHRQSDVTEKYFVRVDVTEEFPFLVTKLSPFYDR